MALQIKKTQSSSAFKVVESAPAYGGEQTASQQNEPVAKTPSSPSEQPAEARQTEAPASTGLKAKLKGSRKLQVAAVAGLIAILAAGYFGTNYWTTGRFLVSTDDAYVRAHNATLAAKVSGYVSTIPVEDNAQLRAGDVIATIDDGDYKIAVDSAREKVASQQATVQRFDSQIVAQQAAVEQARAQLLSAQAGAKRAQSEFERQKALAGNQYASQQTFEQALANRDQANAQIQNMQGALDAAIANIDVLKAQKEEAARSLDELKTALAKAERDLSFTVIRAPIDGVLGNRAIQTGDYVQVGQRLAALVPLDSVYIDANFKETQVGRLKPGQAVSVSVDALPGHPLDGVVESLSPASGAVFSLLPPDNATGNFTKIVQRLPVRIAVPVSADSAQLLRPGLSVIVSVNTKPGVAAKFAANRKTVAKNAAIVPQPAPHDSFALQPVPTAVR